MPRLFHTTLLHSSECHLHSYDFRHSLSVITFFSLDTQQNEFPKHLDNLNIDYTFSQASKERW